MFRFCPREDAVGKKVANRDRRPRIRECLRAQRTVQNAVSPLSKPSLKIDGVWKKVPMPRVLQNVAVGEPAAGALFAGDFAARRHLVLTARAGKLHGKAADGVAAHEVAEPAG